MEELSRVGTIIRRPQFINDIRNVWEFIARDSEERADIFLLELEQRYRALADNPFPGVQRFPRYLADAHVSLP
ncbi:MAG: type II toxin-antitoxin system RelE/ParE family toxin [Shinella sp.]|jgi:plasmid stabilization system protein ParE|nr:type II toxin-antitoxin system RelE/ParE family toxin [Shinella sp.]